MTVYSFGSGPTVLPPEVKESICAGINPDGGGTPSVLEMTFTGAAYADIQAEAESRLRSLLSIPETHRVLFLQGGASAHFALVAMNLLGPRDAAGYIDSGLWARRAIAEAAHWGEIRVVGRTCSQGRLPPQESWRISPDLVYLHVTTNETAEGKQFRRLPETGAVPLVADMSGDLLSEPLDVGRFGLIYASAQKNLGVAGLTIVIVRTDLLGRANPLTPAPFDYTKQSAANSRVNTPPTAAVHIANCMLGWLLAQGGLSAMATRNQRKADRLYATIERSGFYRSPVAADDRSRVNVRFHFPDPLLDAVFFEQAEAAGLLHLKGHPNVGGVRANLYNAVPEAAVDALIVFMDRFERQWG
ncbi:3-phosphoserine/phosphohydroxythreonine transaminase [Azospirillum sp. A1-3]|uniref:3-phosphoserine/phosphohydroxythreonine transaminase n=1 Tax=Azospirillum sp. A1-3 TaxID=185874 RepID=UPI0020773C61|nr:3-phosphoserine/phosphohydroxythreonine transaminase [Azospirillum sp. A1-3]MCM8735754.1 3-phosphoserine/phosphohydroxythreonine transaminase [Azospirillum sp. A1-3]